MKHLPDRINAPPLRACRVCSADVAPRLVPWMYQCRSCGLLQSNLVPGEVAIDDGARWRALNPLRRRAFARILDQLEPGTLLDVGCGNGLFVAMARERGFAAVGIDADPRTSEMVGRFPEDVDATYGTICFLDSLEHFEHPGTALAACRRLLTGRGHVVIALPTRRGFLYRTAELLARFGQSGALERLWQAGFPSPHLTYFDPRGLVTLAAANGFARVGGFPVAAVTLRSLWPRLRYTGLGFGAALLAWPAIVGAMPLMRLWPDMEAHIFAIDPHSTNAPRDLPG